jgi:hypothetical protein
MKDLIKYLFSKKNPDCNWFTVIKCRLNGHPKGVFWYNPSGLEPNMTCRVCGDDLG